MKELEEEMKEFPDNFTQDLHYYIKEYKTYFNEFIKTILK